jgi:hypothetical protein
MTTAINKTKLNNLANEIMDNAEGLPGGSDPAGTELQGIYKRFLEEY